MYKGLLMRFSSKLLKLLRSLWVWPLSIYNLNFIVFKLLLSLKKIFFFVSLRVLILNCNGRLTESIKNGVKFYKKSWKKQTFCWSSPVTSQQHVQYNSQLFISFIFHRSWRHRDSYRTLKTMPTKPLWFI